MLGTDSYPLSSNHSGREFIGPYDFLVQLFINMHKNRRYIVRESYESFPFGYRVTPGSITLLGILVQVDCIMPYRANFLFCCKPSSCMLLLAGQITAALFYPSHTPLGLRNLPPCSARVLRLMGTVCKQLPLELLFKSTMSRSWAGVTKSRASMGLQAIWLGPRFSSPMVSVTQHYIVFIQYRLHQVQNFSFFLYK